MGYRPPKNVFILGLTSDGVQRAFASELSPEGERGNALGLVNATVGIGLLFAGIGGGYVWQQFGVSYALTIAGIFVFIGIAILFSVTTKRLI